MAKDGSSGKYLQRRGQSWYARICVPPSLRTAVGSTHLRKALHTKHKPEAERRKWKVVAELKAYLDRLRRGEPEPELRAARPHGDPREWADQIRRLREEGDDDQADTIELLATDEAYEIEAKSGSTAAGRWIGAVYAKGKTLDELFVEWITQAEYKDSTKATYRLAYGDLRAALGYAEGEYLLVEDINDAAVANFVFKFLPASGLSNKAISTRLGALSSLWAYAQQRLAVPPGRNPWQGHKLPRSGKKREIRAFMDSELVALLKGTEKANAWERYPRVRDLMLLGLYTGARLNELCSLRVADVAVADDSASATLAIREGKTNAATRTLAVTHWAVLAVLQRRLAGKKPGAQLFEELRPGGADKKLSDSVSKAFTRYRRACGVPDGTDYHSLRRTFLTLHEHRGTDYVAVARFVGHEIPTMMHAVYSAGASREALLKVADATRYSPEVEKAVAALA